MCKALMLKTEIINQRTKNSEKKIDTVLAYARTHESSVKPKDWPKVVPLPNMPSFWEWECFLTSEQENYAFAVRIFLF